jgi:hypothetical protein
VTIERTGGASDGRTYNVFLLRAWRSGGAWRVSLEDPRTGRRHGFADPRGLVAFLEEHLGALTSQPHDAQGDIR